MYIYIYINYIYLNMYLVFKIGFLTRASLQEVQGRSCLTDFHGMTLTRDKICSLIKCRGSLRLPDDGFSCMRVGVWALRLPGIGF